MSKRVRETNAGQSISAWIITKGRRYVATVQAHYGDSGACTVDVYQPGKDFQQGRAGGYGYDKFTAALSGLTIDGHKMTDHCGAQLKPPKGRRTFPRDHKERRGYRFANWKPAGRDGSPEEGYLSCYRLDGMKYLEAIGYAVHQAI